MIQHSHEVSGVLSVLCVCTRMRPVQLRLCQWSWTTHWVGPLCSTVKCRNMSPSCSSHTSSLVRRYVMGLVHTRFVLWRSMLHILFLLISVISISVQTEYLLFYNLLAQLTQQNIPCHY